MNPINSLIPEATPVEKTVAPAGMVVNSRWKRNLLTFLMVFGPGLIVMIADNDAGAVSTYTQAGAQYGTKLLWVMLLLLPITCFIQEMSARLGIATGQGHAAMIYRRFGKWWGAFSLFDLLVVNFLTLVTEFALINLALSQLGISPFIGVPLTAAGLIFLVMSGSYLKWERVVKFLCFLNVAWLWLAFMGRIPAHTMAHDLFVPSMPAFPKHTNLSDLIFMIIAMVGTTIAPWQLFFQQSCVADKKLRFADLKWERLDTFIGAGFTILMAGCMMLVGNLMFTHHLQFEDPAQMARALGGVFGPRLGPIFKNCLLLLAINAAVLGTSTISLSSAWAYGEVKGWPHSLHKSIKDAPGFYLVYSACVFLAAAIVLIPHAPLQLIILGVQVLAGVMLPSAVIFMQLLLNDRELLGEQYSNKPWNNVINWTIIAVLFALSLILAAEVVLGKVKP